jgi:hypothetical protein
MSLVESNGVMLNRSVITEGSIESGLSGAAIGQSWQSGDVAIIWLSRGGCLTCFNNAAMVRDSFFRHVAPNCCCT